MAEHLDKLQFALNTHERRVLRVQHVKSAVLHMITAAYFVKPVSSLSDHTWPELTDPAASPSQLHMQCKQQQQA